jgi:alanyl-tRNA synthetase
MLKVKDLRNSFIDYFKSKDHRIVPSSPLLPKDDPTLLFTTAGMVQFKPMFAGTVDLEYTRAASIQKCLRTSDLEQVGRTKRHMTFFEMLGNFSFGDYFKNEAIEWAWEFSTDVIKFPKEKIWISIFENDDEAFEIWNKKIGVPSARIVRLGRKDNFWGPAGDSGACGPCSELYLDRGENYGCGNPDCKPGCDCDRFLEFWNLVFNQFYQDTTGKQIPLPKTGIDTGMGLERLATLEQNVDSVFETDEMMTLIKFISSGTGKEYKTENIIPMNVIADHARTLSFAMSDGIYPSNDGRGYVLRRILRRALRYGRMLSIREPFIYRLVDPVSDIMSPYYPELKDSVKNIKNVIESEEKRFLETIENGMDRLDEIIKRMKKAGGKLISGSDAFTLYDTFGFPYEMTEEIAQENSLSIDRSGFEKNMQDQRDRGKQSWKGADGLGKIFDDAAKSAGDTVFLGYDTTNAESEIVLVYSDASDNKIIKQDEEGFIVLKGTPFYGEAGGQVGDIGKITSGKSVFEVTDTKKINKTIIHTGKVISGEFKTGSGVRASVDVLNRNLIRANHTATHLLQAALRNLLGSHVKQAGSRVDPERMRFDFSHFSALSQEEISGIEKTVNEKIWSNIPVNTKVMNLDDAVKSGAMAVFDEKYEDKVRVVSVEGFSSELCGGTHVSKTGEIGFIKIIKESSPGAGLRRIEAVTLKGAMERLANYENIVSEISGTLNVSEHDIIKKIEDTSVKFKSLEKELEKIKRSSLASGIDEMISRAVESNGIKIIFSVFNDMDADSLRELTDRIRSKEQNSVVLFGSEIENKALFLFAATTQAVNKGADCGAVIREASKIAGGGGGGRKDMAQAGGKDPSKIDAAIKEAVAMTIKMLGKK